MGKAKKFFMYLILTVASILSVFPLYYMFCASTNRSIDVIAGKLIPGTYLIDNFKALIAQQNLRLALCNSCLLYTSPSPRDGLLSRMPSSA